MKQVKIILIVNLLLVSFMRRFTFCKASACETEHALDNLISYPPPKK